MINSESILARVVPFCIPGNFTSNCVSYVDSDDKFASAEITFNFKPLKTPYHFKKYFLE